MFKERHNNGEWVKGLGAGKTPYLAYHDQEDTDVVSSGLLLGLSCAGDFELKTGYFDDTDTYVTDSPLGAGSGGLLGSVDLLAGLATGSAIVGFASGARIDTTKTNSEGGLVGGPNYALRLRTRWIPVTS